MATDMITEKQLKLVKRLKAERMKLWKKDPEKLTKKEAQKLITELMAGARATLNDHRIDKIEEFLKAEFSEFKTLEDEEK